MEGQSEDGRSMEELLREYAVRQADGIANHLEWVMGDSHEAWNDELKDRYSRHVLIAKAIGEKLGRGEALSPDESLFLHSEMMQTAVEASVRRGVRAGLKGYKSMMRQLTQSNADLERLKAENEALKKELEEKSKALENAKPKKIFVIRKPVE